MAWWLRPGLEGRVLVTQLDGPRRRQLGAHPSVDTLVPTAFVCHHRQLPAEHYYALWITSWNVLTAGMADPPWDIPDSVPNTALITFCSKTLIFLNSGGPGYRVPWKQPSGWKDFSWSTTFVRPLPH